MCLTPPILQFGFTADLNLDVLDSTGAQENSVRADLYKVPLDHRGRRAFTGTFRSVRMRRRPGVPPPPLAFRGTELPPGG